MATFLQAPRLTSLAPVAVDDQQRRTVAMAVSLLLDYPADNFNERVETVAEALADLPTEIADKLREFLHAAARLGARGAAEHYVETFDQRRRTSLYLSYYGAGDTRQRGSALLAFQKLYSACGAKLQRDELPDYLPAVLELAAQTGDEIVFNVLHAHRDAIEVMRSALHQAKSPYAALLDALTMSMGEVDEAVMCRVRELITAGPPAELVGAPYSFHTDPSAGQ